jgi:gluconate 2-dehydrogenase gamma chain
MRSFFVPFNFSRINAREYNRNIVNITRRDWMLAAACWAEILRPREAAAATSENQLTWFDPATAAEIKAISGQIIPDDGTPGAEAAGVIWFVDRALAGFDQDKRELYKRGLADAQSKRAELFPGSTSSAGLTSAQQIELLKAIEKTEFFQQVRVHSILGFFGHPKYGGNRNMVGWKLLGIEHSMQYKPPFGYYDAEAASGGSQ